MTRCSDGQAVLAFDGDERGARGHAVSVGPVAARILERAAFAGMLDREEQRATVGRELAAADFTAGGTTRELLQPAALRPAGPHHEAAVVRPGVALAIRDDPEPALRVDAEIVGAMHAADFALVRVTREIG